MIITFIEEGRELKVLYCKNFTRPQERDTFIAAASKAPVETPSVL